MSAKPRKGNGAKVSRNIPDRHTDAEALVDALVRDICARQSMVRDVLVDEEEAKPLPFIGSMNMRDEVGAVLASIRQIIQIDLSEFRVQASPESAFALLRSRVRGGRRLRLVDGQSWKPPHGD